LRTKVGAGQAGVNEAGSMNRGHGKCKMFNAQCPMKSVLKLAGGCASKTGWADSWPLSFFLMHWGHELCGRSAELLFGTMRARRKRVG